MERPAGSPPRQPHQADARPRAERYEIRLIGELGDHWRAWFGEMSVRQPGDGTTIITGHLPDQAALHGALQRVRDLGIPLVSVTRLPAEKPPVSPPPSQPNQKGTPA